MGSEEVHNEKFEHEPKDKYLLVYAVFGFFGIIHFLPATFFVTAHDYWMYKFRDTTSDIIDSSHRTTLQAEFSASVTISTHVTGVLGSFLTLFFGHKLNVHFKLYGSLLIIVVLYVIAAIFIHIDTDSWQTGFFVLTMLMVGTINTMNTVAGLTFFSILYKFQPDYLGPYLNGQGVAGIFTSCLQLLSLAVGISTTKSALVYFWVVIGLLIACLVSLIAIGRSNTFYRHYNSKTTHEKAERRMMTWREFFSALKSIWRSLAVLLFYLLVVNTTHPAITSLIVSEGEGQGDWNDVYFVPTTTFVLAAVGDYIGRFVTVKLKPLTNLDGIWFVAFSAARVAIFIPLIMLCNVQPRSHLSVVFPHDYQYILIMVFFSLSNGFLFSIGNLLIPKTVPAEKLEDAYQVNIMVAAVLMGSLSFLGFVSVELL